MPICKACANEADDRVAIGNQYVDGILGDPKMWGHYCGHACCGDYASDCTCQHKIPGGSLRND